MEPRLHPAPPNTRRVSNDRALYIGLAGFRRALRQFLTFSEVATGTEGVTTQQYQAMLSIAASEAGALTMKQLAEEMLFRPNGAVQLIDRLEVLGLVSRTPSKTDRRSVTLSLTLAGAALLKALAAEHRKELLKHKSLLVESLRRLEGM